jgi:hypothetical protein
MVPIGAMTYGEWPNPLASCPGYRLPTGLPITVQTGEDQSPALSSSSISDETDHLELESCAFDAVTYRNPDPGQQEAAVHSLHSFGAVVLIPRHPLQPGHTYRVSMTIGGQNSFWTFSVQAPQQAVSNGPSPLIP